MDVLRVLEEKAWDIEPEHIEEVQWKENWAFWLDGKPEVVSDEPNISDEAFYRLTNNAHRLNAMMKMLQALLDTASEIKQDLEKRIHRRPKPASQSRGIMSLPNEVLGSILAFTASPGERQQPIDLSHVCRRFRAVALREPKLWTTLYSKADPAELDAFLARCGEEVDLHVIYLLSYSGDWTSGFLEKCLPWIHRWKSISITDSSRARSDSFYHLSVADVLQHITLINGDAPQDTCKLESLYISDEYSNAERSYMRPGSKTDSFIPSWNSPRLRNLFLTGYVPSSGSAFSSVTSITFVYSRNGIVVEKLLRFLHATPNITDLVMNMREVTSRSGLFLDSQIVYPGCPSITSFNLIFDRFTLGKSEIDIVSRITGVTNFPNLQYLSVSVEFNQFIIWNRGNGEEAEIDELLRRLSNALLPENYAHSNLTSLVLRLEVTPNFPSITPIDINSKNFTIPLDRISNISSLTVTTFLRTVFTPKRSFEPFGLRVLRLCECNEMNEDSLREMVESLKEAGVWDGIQSVEVENCKGLQYEGAVAAVGVERLRFIDT